uniref:Uncharacterized protein n=1 Tax=Pyramimonas obovata TaxID=1411642 RepID=A0A7S0RBT1_9CHLO|eukprot:CAMPEP_0118958696 /NCGR_PEP_ID=MMETSP1169-20130426/62755_1 /TAXON_ID=36882 /ORGANISM="Pyramimonas obovata, Strain CCMP722" /LENGTH=219 /DNA_ID=CAMNT_0006906821 /DNA_START=56 /DNA_END=715 /DNA_ORIENTATION=-
MSERKFTGSYKVASVSNGKTLDVGSAKGSGSVEYKIDKNLKLKAAFTEDILTKGIGAPGSKVTLSKVGEWNLNYDLSKKESPLSGDYTAKTKVNGKDLTLKAAWQQRNNATTLTTTYAFDKDNKLEALYGVQSQDVSVKATHKTSNGYTLAYQYQHPADSWNASVAKSVKAVNYTVTYNSKNEAELKIAKAPLTLVVSTPVSNTPKCKVSATFEKGFTF